MPQKILNSLTNQFPRFTQRGFRVWLGVPGLAMFFPVKFGSSHRNRIQINADGMGSGLAVTWVLIAILTPVSAGWACLWWAISWAYMEMTKASAAAFRK